MDVGATFKADFSSFEDACAKAQKSITGLKVDITDTGATISGFGTTAPANFSKIGASMANIPIGNLTREFQKFDNTLAAAGVHIAPEIKALAELGKAAGTTASELGGLATAGLVIGTAVAGWKIGRAVADFFDLDAAISQTVSNLFGFGDAAQVAGANADKLAVASAAAKRTITDLGEATAIINMGLLKQQSILEQSQATLAAWRQALASADTVGMQKALDAGTTSVDALSKATGINVEALRHWQSEVAAFRANEKRVRAEEAEFEKAEAKRQEKLHDDMVAHLVKTETAMQQSVASYMANLAQVTAAADAALQKEQANISRLSALQKTLAPTTGPISPEDQAASDIQFLQEQRGVIGYNPIRSAEFDRLENQRLQQEYDRQHATPAVPGRAVGGPVSAGSPYMVGERGPELFIPSSSGAIAPGGGGGGTSTINLVVDGRVLASIVNDHNTRTLKQGRLLPAN